MYLTLTSTLFPTLTDATDGRKGGKAYTPVRSSHTEALPYLRRGQGRAPQRRRAKRLPVELLQDVPVRAGPWQPQKCELLCCAVLLLCAVVFVFVCVFSGFVWFCGGVLLFFYAVVAGAAPCCRCCVCCLFFGWEFPFMFASLWRLVVLFPLFTRKKSSKYSRKHDRKDAPLFFVFYSVHIYVCSSFLPFPLSTEK